MPNGNNTDDLSDPEWIGAQESDLVLQTGATKCHVCLVGDVLPDTKEKVKDRFMVYTRDGTKLASHVIYR